MDEKASKAIEPFLGCWSLVLWTVATADGQVLHPYGEDAWGRLMYLPEGLMTACLMRRRRSHFASANRWEATLPECEAAYREYLSYFGTFSVDAAVGTVIHHVEAATFPNWVGTNLVRSFQFTDETLTLSAVSANGAAHRLVWEKNWRPKE